MNLWGCSRKKILISPADQLRLAVSLFVYIIVYSIILGFMIFYPLYNMLEASTTIEEQALISGIVLYLHKRVWLGLFIVAVLGAVNTVISTHKFVGPMYRFQLMVKELIGGNYVARVRIRKRDRFREMEKLLNGLADGLELEKSRNQQFYADIKTRLETVSAMLEAEGAQYPDDVKRHIQDIVRELNTKRR